ncbi:hypothetical protein HNY73_007925 [Argiope bruennichi]|uniref:Uncharacterized protein n=1 Tax=Argiope bruennichi TaxID=94029 RepID=A0A8T0F9P3_ARGBR|nr:hypothetical protein HNY73_007925 [Argiope bruennichi]
MCELHFVDDFVKKAYGLTQKQRDCPEEKEQSALIQAIEDSIRENEIYVKSRSFGSLKEFRLKCRSINLLSHILSTCIKVLEKESKDDVLNSVKDVLQVMMHNGEGIFSNS